MHQRPFTPHTRLVVPTFGSLADVFASVLGSCEPAASAVTFPIKATMEDGTLTLKAELPGIQPSQVGVTAEDDRLTITVTPKEGAVRTRTLGFAREMDFDGLQASMDAGLLTVVIPPRKVRARQFTVNAGGASEVVDTTQAD